MLKYQDYDVNAPDWIPNKLSHIRGLIDLKEQWFVWTPFSTTEYGTARIIPKKFIERRLIEVWMRRREKLCSSLKPVGHKNIKGLVIYVSTAPVPNYACCIEPATVVDHARRLGHGHLGDYWLVRFVSGNTSYIDSDSLYRRQSYSNLTYL